MEATLEKRLEDAEKKLVVLSMRISLLEQKMDSDNINRCVHYIPLFDGNGTSSVVCRICGKTKQEHLI
jgi:hypothetical protein